MSDNPSVHKEVFWMLVENRIGQGIARQVYDSKILPDSVIKVETGVGSFQNILEWETWQRIQYTEHAKWFAPCEWISPCGLVLVMKKTCPIPKEKYPKQMPVFLTDFKRTNYGLYKGKIVCHDYGSNCLMEEGMSKRMRKIEWWDL